MHLQVIFSPQYGAEISAIDVNGTFEYLDFIATNEGYCCVLFERNSELRGSI
jgi:hypothetical protein